MATPKQSRTPAARPGGGKSRDKGTRGGRPEPVRARTASRGNGQRANGQRGQASRMADRPPARPPPPGPRCGPSRSGSS